MRRVFGIAAVMVLAGASACASGAKEKEFDTSDAQAIRQVSGDLETAFNAKDLDKILSLYTENSVFMPPNKPLLRGREPLKGFYNGMLTAGAHDLKITVDDVAGHGPIAYESGSYTLQNGAARDRGKFLFVLRNMASNWKIEYTSWSSDLPPAMP